MTTNTTPRGQPRRQRRQRQRITISRSTRFTLVSVSGDEPWHLPLLPPACNQNATDTLYPLVATAPTVCGLLPDSFPEHFRNGYGWTHIVTWAVEEIHSGQYHSRRQMLCQRCLPGAGLGRTLIHWPDEAPPSGDLGPYRPPARPPTEPSRHTQD